MRRGGASRLFLLLPALAALVAAGCASKDGARNDEAQAVIAVQPIGVSAAGGDARAGADLLVKRLELLGVPHGQAKVVRRDGGLAVELPRGRVAASRLQRVTKTAALELYDLERDVAAPSRTAQGEVKPSPSMYALLAAQQPQVEFQGADAWDLFDTKTKKLVAGPSATPEALFETRAAKARNAKPGKPPYVVFGVPKHTAVVSCGSDAVACPGTLGAARERSWYLLTHDPENPSHPVPELTGDDLDLSATRAEAAPTNEPVVLTHFKGAGREKFRALTRALYQRGRRVGRPQHIAIVVDREIKTFPQIDYSDPSLAGGIEGDVQIASLRSEREARELALALRAGALPFRFVRVQ